MPTQISLQIAEDRYLVLDTNVLPPIGTHIDVDRAYSADGSWFTVEVTGYAFTVHSQEEGEENLVDIKCHGALISDRRRRT